ncbi:methyltransferase-like protein isoform X2 [Panicum miliaceum]|uniref:Methyltransferase-like protein isoform X2 n=1 Tax=Panicum miliaceum TaxID=4540 RepID=A0A3L6T7Q1_PANMI|nr:methyltransferase-like protein isoform X2 [Panicum miliaceum]
MEMEEAPDELGDAGKDEAEAEYHSHDFEWEDLRAEVESDPAFSYHLSPFPGPAACTTSPPQPSSEAWRSFHRRHAFGKFFKERRYLLKEFPELPNSKDCAKILEVGCGNDSHHEMRKERTGFLRENQCCVSGMDFITMIFTLSAIPFAIMPSTIEQCVSVLKPGGLLLFRDYGLYDMMLRFLPHQRVGFREYMRSDGTLSYFFTLDTERTLSCCWASRVGAGILLCQVSEPKEREEDAAGMGAWEILEATKLTPTNSECCVPTNFH